MSGAHLRAVGAHKDLLPYLVRRLLENGANSSFVHKLVDPRVPVETLTAHPVATLQRHTVLANPRIPLPPALYGEARRNSRGINMNVLCEWLPLKEQRTAGGTAAGAVLHWLTASA
ncbi:proline dehydrogenase family protein [Halopseudomonas pachastrellae]|nr:proline dehydrogenase family protein [Halopseudomonas pachastrellae]